MSAKAEEPMPYLAEDKRSDVENGRRDGRKQIPAYGDLTALDADPARVATPYQRHLINAGLVRANEEFERFHQRTAQHRQRLARQRGRLPEHELGVQRAEEDVAAAGAEVTDNELMPRNHQELTLGQAVLRSRRELMRERRIAAAREILDRRIEAVAACRAEIAEICERIDDEFARAQEAGRMVGDYFVMRMATYWDALVQRHPDGRNLAARVPAIVAVLPRWVDGTCVGGDITLPDEETS